MPRVSLWLPSTDSGFLSSGDVFGRRITKLQTPVHENLFWDKKFKVSVHV